MSVEDSDRIVRYIDSLEEKLGQVTHALSMTTAGLGYAAKRLGETGDEEGLAYLVATMQEYGAADLREMVA